MEFHSFTDGCLLVLTIAILVLFVIIAQSDAPLDSAEAALSGLVTSIEQGFAKEQAKASQRTAAIDLCVGLNVDYYREHGLSVALSDLPGLRAQCEKTMP